MDALLLSMKLHIERIRSLEVSERVNKASLDYLRHWSICFHPERQDIALQLQTMAKELGGEVASPRLRWKYAWMSPIFGRVAAWRAQLALPYFKAHVICAWDKLMRRLESPGGGFVFKERE